MHKSVIGNILLSIACIVMAYFLFFAEKPAVYDYELINSQKQAIQRENEILLNSVNSLSKKVNRLESELDSLSKEKNKIEIRYVNIYKKIDGYSNLELFKQFDSVFTADNVR